MNTSYFIDINCDMGEGLGNEAELLQFVSSCNIACGGHAGDENTIREVASLAKEHGVKVGAHPAYPDLQNFGRVSMQIPKMVLLKSIRDQLEKITDILNELGVPLNHIKPHGALYNDIVVNGSLAETFLEGVAPFKTKALLYLPYKSKGAKLAQDQGFKVFFEAFGDRNYNDDLSLVSRKNNHALIEDPKKVLKHLLLMIKSRSVTTISERTVQIEADTFCIHGDTSTALQILMYLSKELPKHQIFIKK